MYYEQFEKLLKLHHVKPGQVAKATGISTSTLSSWKNGRYTPKSDKLQLIANFFKVPLSFLTSSSENNASAQDTMISFHSQVQMDKTFQINYDDLELLNNMNKNHKKRQLFKQITDLSDEDVELLLAVAERFAK